MSRIAYVNGRYLRHDEASVHVEDRGYQFSDGVYEVVGVRDGLLMDEDYHLQRLQRSLSELKIAMPVTMASLRQIIRHVVRRNTIRDGMVYLQITRGVSRRDHPFPNPPVKPSIVITAKRVNEARIRQIVRDGVSVITLPDQRWARRDIKSISLLPNILAKQAAREAGAYEAWLIDQNGMVTEGSSTNAWIVDAVGRLVTRSLGPEILSGVTRRVLLEAAQHEGLEVVERAFSRDEAHNAAEAFTTASTAIIVPVVKVDGHIIGTGKPGPLTIRLRGAYDAAAKTG